MQRVWSALETVLRKYPWALVLVALIPCAYFDAAGLTSLVASKLLKADISALTRPAPPSRAELEALSRPAVSYHMRDTNAVLTRNVFDSDAGCLTCAPPPDAAASAAPSASASANPLSPDQSPPAPCEGNVKIRGAVQSDDPLWSMVLASTENNQPAQVFRIGQTLDNKSVASIGWHPQYGAFVLLRATPGGPRCFYAQVMPPRAAPPPPPPPPVAGPPPPSGEGGLAAEIESGISRDGNNAFSIRRGLVDRILENQAELMRTTRIMPHEEGGRVVGVQLFGVRPTSLLGRLGLQNGDVLNRINGLEIASPDRALEAYSRLRTADRLTVSVTRNGAPVNLDFNIR